MRLNSHSGNTGVTFLITERYGMMDYVYLK